MLGETLHYVIISYIISNKVNFSLVKKEKQSQMSYQAINKTILIKKKNRVAQHMIGKYWNIN